MARGSKARRESDHAVDAPGRRRLPPLLRQAWYSLNQLFRRRIAHLGITPDQFTLLRWLQECPPEGLTQRRLTEKMSSDPNTIASLLSRMEKAGMVKRRRHGGDARANLVVASARGRRIFEEARGIAVELQTRAMGGLPAVQRESFLANLEKVADCCRGMLAEKEDSRP